MGKKEKIILLFCILLLIITILIFEFSNFDVTLSNFFFNKNTNSWLISSNNTIYGLIFYRGFKIFLVSIGISLILIFTLSFKFKKLEDLRYITLFLFACMAFIPTFISFLKHTTNIYPPWDLNIFNGNKPYIKLFEKYPADFTQKKKAQGYPAGHASGGFSILCFVYILKKRKYKMFFLLFWMFLGWSMGIYQMVRGAHFLSHTIVSNILSIIITLLLYYLFKKKIEGATNNEQNQ
ncbi:MAG: phosphatase PAP2 family protein [Candidatus Muirbacterium halophilum]|nr:phosphatase PAP2 family protein [Candidatus Muirbacterium halophilum]MCK9475201.1 phosphatase PAP2 family protein [Candidatus Muirbacterium halophilum]